MPLGPSVGAGQGRLMGHVIAFLPASGGVGASTLAAAVAVRAAAAGQRSVVVDLDHVAGRLDVVFGAEEQPGWRWDALDDVIGLVDGAALADRLPSAEGVRLLTHDRAHHTGVSATSPDGAAKHSAETPDRLGVVGDVVAGLVRAHDLTVLDLPRDVATIEAVAGLVDVVVLVVGSRLLQIAAAAASVVALKRSLSLPPAANGVGPAWSGPPAPAWLVLRGSAVSDDLADVVVDHLDLPLAGILGDENRLLTDLESGVVPGARGRGSLVDVADDLLLRLVSVGRAA